MNIAANYGNSSIAGGRRAAPVFRRAGKRDTRVLGTTPKQPSYCLDGALLAALEQSHQEFLRVAVKRTGTLAGGEELVREFYRKAMASALAIKELRGFKRWLIQAFREALASYHQRRPSATGAGALPPPDLDGPWPWMVDEMERAVGACLYRILPTLPKDCSWLIWQVDLISQPFDAVARKMGISPDHLAVRVQRACQTMLEALERFSMICPAHGFLNCTCAAAGGRPGS